MVRDRAWCSEWTARSWIAWPRWLRLLLIETPSSSPTPSSPVSLGRSEPARLHDERNRTGEWGQTQRPSAGGGLEPQLGMLDEVELRRELARPAAAAALARHLRKAHDEERVPAGRARVHRRRPDRAVLLAERPQRFRRLVVIALHPHRRAVVDARVVDQHLVPVAVEVPAWWWRWWRWWAVEVAVAVTVVTLVTVAVAPVATAEATAVTTVEVLAYGRW